MIRRLSAIQANIEAIVNNPVQRGHVTGFKCLDELYTVKKGSFTIWQGAPAHGKSEVIFEILMNHAEDNDEISMIYSPETGSAEEIMIELAHKYIKKQIVRHNPLNPVASELDMYNALAWVDAHFLIVDDSGEEEDGDSGYSFPQLCELCEAYEKENRIRVSHIMAEPYNELNHDMKEHGGRQDIYIEFFLTSVRRYCRRTKKHVHLSFHTGQQKAVTVGKLTFYPMPKAREAAGGQAGLRKAMAWINVWRPPAGLVDDKTKQPYAPNEVLIQIEKAKPKYVCYRGTCSLFFDTVKNRYYEKINMTDCYAYDHKNMRDELVPEIAQGALTFPSVTANNDDVDELPF